jgi:hypothetical protein
VTENLVLILDAPLPYDQVLPEQRLERAVKALAHARAKDEELRRSGFVSGRKHNHSIQRVVLMQQLVEVFQDALDRSGEHDFFG